MNENRYPPVPPYYEDEIDLYDLWLVLKKRKKVVFAPLVLSVITALIVCFTSPPVYKTQATLMPLGGKSKLLSILSALSVPSTLLQGTAGETVEAVLKSRTLRERNVEKLNLLPVLFKSKWDEKAKAWKLGKGESPPNLIDGANALKNCINVTTDRKTKVLILSVEYPKDPELCYKIAVTALQLTRQILNEKAFTLAREYREYIEKQLALAKEKYRKLEEIYSDFVNGKLDEVPFIIGTEELEAIGKLNERGTGNLTNEIERLKSRVVNLQKSSFVYGSKYQLNMIRLKTQLEVVKGLLTVLAREYELAKAKEMKESISFQVVDPPYVPKKPYKPKKRLILAVSAVSGLFLGVFLSFFVEWLENARREHAKDQSTAG